jgi:hypothetical protein
MTQVASYESKINDVNPGAKNSGNGECVNRIPLDSNEEQIRAKNLFRRPASFKYVGLLQALTRRSKKPAPKIPD